MPGVTGASLGFYATREDMRDVFEFLFTSTDVRVLPLSSESNQRLKAFRTVEEVCAHWDRRAAKWTVPNQINLLLWSTSAMGSRVRTKRTDYKPGADGTAAFRCSPVGGGMMQLYIGAVDDGRRRILASQFGHQSEARARNWDAAHAVDWRALKLQSNAIAYHVRKRLAAEVVQARAILPGALELVRQGYDLPGFLPATMNRLRVTPTAVKKLPKGR